MGDTDLMYYFALTSQETILFYFFIDQSLVTKFHIRKPFLYNILNFNLTSPLYVSCLFWFLFSEALLNFIFVPKALKLHNDIPSA